MLVLIVLIELLLGKMTAINSIRLLARKRIRCGLWDVGEGKGDSSDTEEEDTDSTQSDVITKYNQAMACLSAAAGVENPPLLTHQIINWETASEKESVALKELLKLVGLFAILLLQTMERTC